MSRHDLQSNSRSGRVGAVVVARMQSSRLPGKSMIDLAGRPSLEWIIRRLSRSRFIQTMIVATTTEPADDPIAALAERLGHVCFRGSEDDVLGRVHGAIQKAGLDVVVHVTGDCPCIDAGLADTCVEQFFAEPVDYVSIDQEAHPPGLDVEVFRAEALARVESTFTDPWIREHVTVPFYTMPERFSACKVPVPNTITRPNYRICLDTPQDYALIHTIYQELLPVNEYFDAHDIVRLLDERPDLAAINAGVTEVKHPCAVIGLGAVGSLYERQPFARTRTQTHVRAYLRYGKTHLVAGCDVNPARRTDFVADWSIERVYASAEEMFDRERPAIVSVATPAETHAEICLQAVRGGVKAILCEKPFVPDCDEGRTVIETCNDHGVLLAVNCWRRWSRRYRALREYVHGGRFGEIQSVRLHYTKGIVNNGSHAIDLVRFLFGEVKWVLATESIPTNTEDHDLGGILGMVDGLNVHLTVSDYRAHFDFELDIIGTKGRVQMTDDRAVYWTVEPDENEPGVNRLVSAPVPFDTDIGTPFEDAVAELVAHVEGNTNTAACCGADGLRAMEIAQALLESWKTGSRMELREPHAPASPGLETLETIAS